MSSQITRMPQAQAMDVFSAELGLFVPRAAGHC